MTELASARQHQENPADHHGARGGGQSRPWGVRFPRRGGGGDSTRPAGGGGLAPTNETELFLDLRNPHFHVPYAYARCVHTGATTTQHPKHTTGDTRSARPALAAPNLALTRSPRPFLRPPHLLTASPKCLNNPPTNAHEHLFSSVDIALAQRARCPTVAARHAYVAFERPRAAATLPLTILVSCWSYDSATCCSNDDRMMSYQKW